MMGTLDEHTMMHAHSSLQELSRLRDDSLPEAQLASFIMVDSALRKAWSRLNRYSEEELFAQLPNFISLKNVCWKQRFVGCNKTYSE